jgi:hypothetical protein
MSRARQLTADIAHYTPSVVGDDISLRVTEDRGTLAAETRKAIDGSSNNSRRDAATEIGIGAHHRPLRNPLDRAGKEGRESATAARSSALAHERAFLPCMTRGKNVAVVCQ